MIASLSVQSFVASRERRWLGAIVLLAVTLRLIFLLALVRPADVPGGDTSWYLEAGLQLVHNQLNYAPQPAPLFLIYNGLVQLVFPGALSYPALQVLNIGWQMALIVAVYALGLRYFSPSVARLAALAVAVNPIFIIETAAILTENLFLGFLFAALAWYAWQQDRPSARSMALTGLLLGLTSLTRAVVLAFPLLLMAHVISTQGWRRGLRLAGVLGLVFALVMSTWTVYGVLRWNRFVIGAEGLTAFAWMGATGISDKHDTDAQLGAAANNNQRDPEFVRQFIERFTANFLGYVGTRAGNLIESVLQPHNTTYFPGESLKDLALNWLRSDRTVQGAARVLQGDSFWPKLVLYLFHFWALILGTAGMLLNWRRFRGLLPLYGYVLYTLIIHSVLFATPRYIFPTEPILILFAAAFSIGLVARKPPAMDYPQVSV